MKRVSLHTTAFLFGLLALCAAVASYQGAGGILLAGPAEVWDRLLWPLMRVSFFIAVGLFTALIVEGAGWTDRLAILARPFMRWGRLSDHMGSAFTTSFFSGTSSLAMLSGFLREGKMGRREVVLAVLLDTFPSYFLHLPTTFFIILPLVGRAGVVYLLVTFFAALLRFCSVLVYTRFSLPEPDVTPNPPARPAPDRRGLFTRAAKGLSTRLARVLLIVAPVYLIMLLVSDMGFFDWLRRNLALGISRSLLPVEGISVVILSLVAEVTSGYAAAGAMLESGALTLTQTVVALIAGQILAAPLRALRHQLPYYMGLFSPGLGMSLIAATQCFRILSLAIAGALFLLIL
jgi:hypothetical protein